MKKIYTARYSSADHDGIDYDIFVTENKALAEAYVEKFNSILKKWKDYYSQFEEDIDGWVWIKEEHNELYFHRWHTLKGVNGCYVGEIEIRN